MNGDTTYVIKFKDREFDISNFENFALFGTLSGATISNLYVEGEVFSSNGQESSTKFINSFAKQDASMLNLSLIAVNTVNSTLNNINVKNIEFELEIEKVLSHVYVSSMVAYMQGGTISNCSVDNFSVNFIDKVGTVDAETGSIYGNDVENNSAATTNIGGIVAKAVDGVVITNSSVVDFKLSQEKTYTVALHVGGVVGHLTFENGTQVSTLNEVSVGVYPTERTVERQGVVATEFIAKNLGGLVGYSEYVNITNCSTIVNYMATEHGYATNIGGIVGVSNNTTMNIIKVDITIGVEEFTSSQKDQFIGVVAGDLKINSSLEGYTLSAEILNAEGTLIEVSNIKEKTEIEGLITALGLYGNKDESGVTIK